MAVVGIRAAPTCRQAIKNDVKKICHLLSIEHLNIILPQVFWLKDGEAVRQKHNEMSGCVEINELYGIYAPLHNQIYLSRADYTPHIFWHELAHCVLWQSGLHWRMSVIQEESLCERLAGQMMEQSQ